LGDIVADAGPDQCLTAAGGSAAATLDASASATLDGTVKSVLWHVPGAPGCQYFAGNTVTVHLPPGQYSIDVQVTDSAGNTATDTLLVAVQ
jgi:hypothetical protein